MHKIMLLGIIMILVAVGMGCSSGTKGSGPEVAQVREQQLAVYMPLRRFSYKNTCGGDGSINVCVERITLSDTAAHVELRISSNSGRPSLPMKAAALPLLIKSSAGTQLYGWTESVGRDSISGGRLCQCRLEGQLLGKPQEMIVWNPGTMHLANRAEHEQITIQLGG